MARQVGVDILAWKYDNARKRSLTAPMLESWPVGKAEIQETRP